MKKLLKYLKLIGGSVAFASLISGVAVGQTFPSNTLKLGNKTASDKKIIFDKGSGAANPLFKWDNTKGKLQFSNDGSLFKDIGSGSGSGSAGVNVLSNPGFEDGASINWTNSGGTYTEVTSGSNLLFGEKSVTFDASATGQYVQSDLYDIPVGLQGTNCEASIYYKGGDTNLKLEALDGSSNVLATRTFESAATYSRKFGVTFVCPTSGQVRLRVSSTADAALVALDSMHLGQFTTFDVSQAVLVGDLIYPYTAACTWNLTSASYTDFGVDTDCPAPTIYNNPLGIISSVDDNLPQVTLTNAAPGYYVIYVDGGASTLGSASNYVGLRLSDGSTTSGQHEFYINSTDIFPFSLVGVFSYQTAGTRTFKLQGYKNGATTLGIHSDTGWSGPRFVIKRFPLASEAAFRPDTIASSWTGYHGQDCLWSRTNTSPGDPATDATCTFTERTNTNFGTVTSAVSGDKLPGYVFTPNISGKFFACYQASIAGSTDNAAMYLRFVADSFIIAESETKVLVVNREILVTACGIFEAVAGTAKTVKLQFGSSLGSVTLNNSGTSQATIEWSIYPITQQIPAPLIVNSVVSPSSGVERIVRARFTNTGSCAVADQSGTWISSVSDPGTGQCQINIASGTFSSAPQCGGTLIQVNGELVTYNAFTSNTLYFQTNNSSGTATDSGFQIVCMGPK